jgi:hypothetical protein
LVLRTNVIAFNYKLLQNATNLCNFINFMMLGEPWMYTAWNSAEPSGIGGFAGSYGASAIEWDWKEREENETSYFVCES